MSGRYGVSATEKTTNGGIEVYAYPPVNIPWIKNIIRRIWVRLFPYSLPRPINYARGAHCFLCSPRAHVSMHASTLA